MNIALWIAQGLLAVDFIVHGWVMWFPSRTLPMGLPYIQDLPTGFRRFIGTAEILAGIGLILPGLTGILPWLTLLAAIGIIILMLCAIVYNFRRKDYNEIKINLLQIALAVFVVIGRLVLVPLYY
jgi:uncharacterized membrane protein YphA (DoxX/SURF4 family)